jgi:hypothetical protein
LIDTTGRLGLTQMAKVHKRKVKEPMPSGHYQRDAAAKAKAYELRAIESYQPMVDALRLVRPLAVRACDDEAIAAIDKALAAAGIRGPGQGGLDP